MNDGCFHSNENVLVFVLAKLKWYHTVVLCIPDYSILSDTVDDAWLPIVGALGLWVIFAVD